MLCRYYSVTIFCDIGLPGFAASVAIGAVGLAAMILSLAVIDRVSNINIHCIQQIIEDVSIIS